MTNSLDSNKTANSTQKQKTNRKKNWSDELNTKARKQIGNSGEIRACEYLKACGYEIVDTNFRTRTGEIDIIAFRDNTIIFVEVKTLLLANPEVLAKELNQQKRKRIVETSKYFLTKHRQYSNSFVRFDVVVIDMPGYPSVYHIENAFLEFS
ncbi:YraN family protein [Treponema sp.]|uniref:YraN family protein n=1 Tax=Treponema sp. TaxID=166 RepID=UPI00298DB008|nr:YraN family protein [Treponema sp.]